MFHPLDITLKPRQDSSNSSFRTLNVSVLMKIWIWVIICCVAFSKERKQGKNRTEKQLYSIAALWAKSAGSLSRKVGEACIQEQGRLRREPILSGQHLTEVAFLGVSEQLTSGFTGASPFPRGCLVLVWLRGLTGGLYVSWTSWVFWVSCDFCENWEMMLAGVCQYGGNSHMPGSH